jgi:hypothetical protein
MARFVFDLRTDASPEAVRTALLDFSESRPGRWPGLPPDQYEVYGVGDTWAEIREGYRGPIWWRERYEWSASGPVVCTAVDSGFGATGSFVRWDIGPADGGGSRVHIIWDRRGKTLFGRLFVGVLAVTRGFFVRRSVQLGLTRIAALEAGHRR